MIYTGLSEDEIKKVTSVLECYGHPYEVRISDYMVNHNSKKKKDWVGAYHLNVASTDILEIEFEPEELKTKVSKEEYQKLLDCRIMLDEDELISYQEVGKASDEAWESFNVKFSLVGLALVVLTLLGFVYLVR